jgi:Zn-dependent membrane protease YugP
LIFGVTILGIALMVFVLEQRLSGAYRKELNRRNIAGHEISRYILDQASYSQFSVDASTQSSVDQGKKQLFLNQSLYEGTSLLAIARAAKHTVQLMHSPPSFSFSVLKHMHTAVVAAWLFLILGGVFQGELLKLTSIFIFWLFMIFAMIDLPRQMEASKGAYYYLKQSDYFEVDELIKLGRVLTGLRFDELSQIYRAPANFLLSLIGKKRYGI